MGAFVGLLLGFAPDRGPLSLGSTYHSYPLPHCVPKYPGGVSLRFAMVHDVLHERYTRHGEAYYRERNRLVREAMRAMEAEQGPDISTDKYFALPDDLGAGLDALKDDDEAVGVLRDKLRRQLALGQSGRQLYTTYANLGTFLIHGNFRQAVAGDVAAKERVREGLDFIAKSIDVNPEAHFGREIWQSRAGDFLLDATDKPHILLERDLVGNWLHEELDPSGRRSISGSKPGESVEDYGRYGLDRETILVIEDRKIANSAGYSREALRAWITRVGDPRNIPFDEPTLGIVGMWRLGGGANPHFALALGEIMIRVGQRSIAWCAFERAATMADRFWPDAEIQRKFVSHCRKRQMVIEQQLPEEDRFQLRPRFDVELAYGRRYQEAYQAYEAERIAEGASINHEHFYDAFFASHEPIASPVGDADLMVVEHGEPEYTFSWPRLVLCAGIFAFIAACIPRLGTWLTGRNRRLARPS
jgi:hypothetical protein